MKKRVFVGLAILIFGVVLCTVVQAADFFDWNTRTDRYGKPAVIFEATPFPIY